VSGAAAVASRAARGAAALLLAGALAACGTLGAPRSPVPSIYDLGPITTPVDTGAPLIDAAFVVPATRSPEWLEGPGMMYRLLYEDPARPQAYSLSRWAAEPSSLFTDRLRVRLAAVSQGVVTPGYSARVSYMLRAELDDFSQVFDAPNASRVVMRARVTLLTGLERKLLGQRSFVVERPSAPHAPGAARALAEATDLLIDELLQWARQTVADGGMVGASATPAAAASRPGMRNWGGRAAPASGPR
jgi:cholesterol transport system auxiliary component